MDLSSSIKKAYDAYRKVAARDFLHVTTTQLNVVYNVLCRMKKDEEYRNAIYKAAETDEPLDKLIERYFLGYNNLHGLDITETLTEFENPELADGSYFIITTYVDGCERSPISLRCGEVCKVKAVHYSRATESELSMPRLRTVISSDDGTRNEFTTENADRVEFDLTLTTPGGIRFKIFVEDESGKNIIGSETAYGGLLFDIESIKPVFEAPKDLENFWRGEIARLMSTDPISTVPDGYSGRVVYEYGITDKNAYSIKKVDKEYLELMRERALPAPADERLSDFDVYEVYLKAPGPCPATAYLSIPKTAEKNSLDLSITYDGYSAHTPSPILANGKITLHCTHHGYELCKPDKDYYNHLNGSGILGNYGRANGKTNSDYVDIHDCYLLYTLLRNLQFIRFVADPEKAAVIPNLSEYFSGRVIIGGGSMGGYQTVCVGGLCELMAEVQSGFKVVTLMPSIPAFCDVASGQTTRVSTQLHSYEEGIDYFDAAHLGRLIRADLVIPRVGLGDETCPHTSITAMVNNIPSGYKKDINYLQNSSHGYVTDPQLQKWYKYGG